MAKNFARRLTLWTSSAPFPQRGSHPSKNSPHRQPYRVTTAFAFLTVASRSTSRHASENTLRCSSLPHRSARALALAFLLGAPDSTEPEALLRLGAKRLLAAHRVTSMCCLRLAGCLLRTRWFEVTALWRRRMGSRIPAALPSTRSRRFYGEPSVSLLPKERWGWRLPPPRVRASAPEPSAPSSTSVARCPRQCDPRGLAAFKAFLRW
jgi:hypothetical protein